MKKNSRRVIQSETNPGKGERLVTLTKADIAQKIASECGFVKHEAAEFLEKLLGIMKKKLTAGEEVLISGFGKWTVKSKRARKAKNLQTGQEIILDARRVVTWKYSPVLKARLNMAGKG
jgi:integration host factor subunit alpha